MLSPVRDGNHTVQNLNHAKLLEGLKCQLYRRFLPPEDGCQHFVRVGDFITQQEHTAVIHLPGKAQELKPDHNNRVRLRQALNQQNLLIVEDICRDLNPFDIRHVTLLPKSP